MRSISRIALVTLVSSILAVSASAQRRLDLSDKSEPERPQRNEGASRARATRTREPATPAKKAPARKPARKAPVKIPASAATIVQELKREFEAGKLRTKSEYLTENPDAEMTAEVIMAMLARRHGTSDAMDAYIKWQLLSGLGESFTEEQVDEGLAAYRNAPAIQWRPGITQEHKRVLDREIKRYEDPSDLTAMLVDETRRVEILNEPILKYREELFKRLPNDFYVLQAALIDLYQRGEAGISPRGFVGTVAKRIREWSATASPDELADMADMLDELLQVKLPSYYVTIRHEPKDNSYKWSNQTAKLDEGGRLEQLAIDLANKAGQ